MRSCDRVASFDRTRARWRCGCARARFVNPGHRRFRVVSERESRAKSERERLRRSSALSPAPPATRVGLIQNFQSGESWSTPSGPRRPSARGGLKPLPWHAHPTNARGPRGGPSLRKPSRELSEPRTRAIRQAEVGAAQTMLERTEERFGLRPDSLVADTAYGSADNLAWLVKQKQITPHIPVFDKSGRTDGTFSRSDFTFDSEAECYICPAGKDLVQFRRAYAVPRTGLATEGMACRRHRPHRRSPDLKTRRIAPLGHGRKPSRTPLPHSHAWSSDHAYASP